MTNDTLLFAAAQLKKYCKNTKCEECIFSKKKDRLEIFDCRLDTVPDYWDIDKLIGENH